MKHLSQSCASNSHNHISSNKQSQGKLSKIQEEALGDTVIQEKQSSHPEAKSPIDLGSIIEQSLNFSFCNSFFFY
jgi:hypothetical protein